MGDYNVSIGDNEMPLFLNKFPSLPINGDHKTCACIGSSGILLDKEYGELIDTYDIVIRMNDSRIYNYEKHVGTKTNIRILNGSTFSGTSDPIRFPKGGDRDWIFSEETKNQTFIVKSWNNEELAYGILKNQNRNPINFFNPHFTLYCNNLTGNQEATTGFIGIMFALMFFERVDLFGFGFYQEGNWKKFHFYEEVQQYKPGHDFVNEKNLIEGFEKQNKIKIYR